MADLTKYSSIISDIKSYFSTRRSKRSYFSLASGFIFIIIVFFTTINSSSPYLLNMSTYILTTTTTFVPYSLNMSISDNVANDEGDKADNTYVLKPIESLQVPVFNQTVGSGNISPKYVHDDKVGVLEKHNSSSIFPDVNKVVDSNISTSSHEKVVALKGNGTITNSGENVTADGEKATGKNLTSSIVTKKLRKGTNVVKKKHTKKKRRNGTNVATKKQNNSTHVEKETKGNDDLMKGLMNCDLFNGDWVKDDSYPLYKQGSCALVDEQFNCFLNGRPDNDYQKLKWKPKDCTLPRLNGGQMLELLKGKRLVFVGDSLNRNMWESLVCILKNSVKDQTKVYERNGSYKFRTKASYSFVFEEYKAMVEFYVSPFLVEQWEAKDENGTTKETLRLDIVSSLTAEYRDADILVFNTAHWWNLHKTYSGKNYFQEGSNLYRKLKVLEAFRKGLTTWGRWVDANVNPKKSLVFFRGSSAVHFSRGQWNSGGECHNETEPITDEIFLSKYPKKMKIVEKVLRGMKTHVNYLNVTKMSDYRKDGHPSIYRFQNKSDEEKRSPWKIQQDCSHWCLPGVPDAWNEILYAQLLVKMYHKQH